MSDRGAREPGQPARQIPVQIERRALLTGRADDRLGWSRRRWWRLGARSGPQRGASTDQMNCAESRGDSTAQMNWAESAAAGSVSKIIGISVADTPRGERCSGAGRGIQ